MTAPEQIRHSIRTLVAQPRSPAELRRGDRRRWWTRPGHRALPGLQSRDHQRLCSERGWLVAATWRNTTLIRSNYLWDESARIYEHR